MVSKLKSWIWTLSPSIHPLFQLNISRVGAHLLKNDFEPTSEGQC